MSQADLLRAFDAAATAAFADAGMADAASYVPPGGLVAVACNVLVDRTAADFGGGEFPIEGARLLVSFFLAELSPVHAGSVTIGSETFVLDREESRDESLSRWVVLPEFGP